MNNKEFIEYQQMLDIKTNHDILGLLFQKLGEIRAITTILNKREEEREVKLMAKKGKPKEEQKPKQ